MNFISNIISNSVAGFVEAGTRTAGGFAGDALIRAGDLIENTGRGVGTSVEGAAASYGIKIAGQGAINSTKGSVPKKAITAGKPVGVQRSYSSPASTSTKKIATKKTATPIGVNKYPGGKTAATPLGANKYPGGTNRSISSISTAKPAATKKPALSGAPKPYPSGNSKPDTTKPKPYPGTTTYPSKAKSSGGAASTKGTDKPYPGTSTKGTDKPYPGTSTIPGSGKKTAVKVDKPKPMPTSYAPPSKAGDTFHRHLPEIKI